ncbi:MAG: type I-A CRISPR-associated protein Cas4/Csa1 [Methermicoccaceae archaeon]
MYYLSDVENQYLLRKLRPAARERGVSEQMRGWSWDESPLRPYYDVKLPMYVVCGKYCPTDRDVYLRCVLNERGTATPQVLMGAAMHKTVHAAYSCVKQGDQTSFEQWYESLSIDRSKEFSEHIRKCAEVVWNHVSVNARSSVSSSLASQPYASSQDVLSTSLPFLVEHRITGELLGLSGVLSLDCYDYMRSIVFDLKVGAKPSTLPFHKLYPTGYAMVFESVYEVPVDIGCTVFLNFFGERMVIQKELFHISDELRSWWVEERDRKAEIVAEGNDPGVASECRTPCMFEDLCARL